MSLAAFCSFAYSALLSQDGDVRVGVLPRSGKVSVTAALRL